jgi:hypothetical protein
MRLSSLTTMSLRADFALHCLRAAARAARTVYEIEQAGAAKTLGPGFNEIVVWVPASIVMAGAALEVNSNELIQDILDKPGKFALTDTRGTLLAELKEDHSGNALDRYRILALLLDTSLDGSKHEWQNASNLVSFRNYFMHFKPRGLTLTRKNGFQCSERSLM